MALGLRTKGRRPPAPEQKKRIEQAASLKGLSLSDFIVQHADELPSGPYRAYKLDPG